MKIYVTEKPEIRELEVHIISRKNDPQVASIVAFFICGWIKAIIRKKQVRVYMEDIKAYQEKIGGQECEETK